MKIPYKASALTAAVLAASTSGLLADPVESSLDSAFGKLEETVPGKFSINSRLRYEEFDLDNGSPERAGTSLRVRYGYTTPEFSGFSAMVEGETLTRVGGNADDIHPLDDAGDGTDLNQAWVQYKNADFGSAKVGRQIYALDDHRFIGHVGWRQNIQTFDGATAAFTGVDKLFVKAFYFDAVNRVNADYFVLDAAGANVSYAFCDALKLTGFYYEVDSADASAWESEVLGVRATGSFLVSDQKFVYAASYADQDNTDTGSADYFAGDLSTVLSGVTLGAGFEILDAGFSTPLATVHKFNGFADVFATPSLGGIANGLEDLYAYIGYTIPVGKDKGIKVKAIYHDFSPEDGSGDYGDEIDLVASYKINKYLSLVGKYGDYNSDGGSGGVGGADKEMFTFELNFVY